MLRLLERQKYTYFLLVVVIILNLIQLIKFKKLETKATYYLEIVNRMKKNEIKMFLNWQESIKLVGNEIILNDFKLLEEISMNEITPVFCISRDICSSCKDDFLKVLEGLRSRRFFNEHLKLILFDEGIDTIGPANEEFIRTFADLYFINSDTFNIEGLSRLPDTFIILVNSDMNIISFYEYQVGHGAQLELYLKAINGDLGADNKS